MTLTQYEVCYSILIMYNIIYYNSVAAFAYLIVIHFIHELYYLYYTFIYGWLTPPILILKMSSKWGSFL